MASEVTQRVWTSSNGDVKVNIEETPILGSLTGFKIWQAAEALCDLLCSDPFLVKSKRVLEVGAGCGLVSAVAASLGGHVTATDRKELLPLLKRNADLVSNGKQNFDVLELDWCASGESSVTGEGSNHFDIVLGSDVTYGGRDCFQPLLQVLWKVAASSSDILCLVAHTVRSLEQAAILWHDICDQWPGVAWVYSGYEELEECHDIANGTSSKLPPRSTEGDDPTRESVIHFALSVVAPSENLLFHNAYCEFLHSSQARPLQRPKVSEEVWVPGMVGPQIKPPGWIVSEAISP